MARRRERLRLAGYDYSSPGATFVTICLQDRLCLLGEIMTDTCLPTEAGHMVHRWWEQQPNLGSNVELDEYLVMPNHLHGVIILVDADLRAGPENQGAHVGAPLPETAVGADLRVGPDQQGAHIGAPLPETAVGADLRVGPDQQGAYIGAPLPETAVGADLHVGPVQQGAHIGAPPRGQSSEPTSVRRLIQCFRTMTTHETMGGSRHPGSLGSGTGSGNAATTITSSALNAS